MRVCVLGSGSAGNCTYVEEGRTRLLVDIGFGPRSLKRRLKDAGLPSDRFDGVLLTHGHVDHYSGLEALIRDYQTPVFANRGTRCEIFGADDFDDWRLIRTGVPFSIGSLRVEAFGVSHDAAEPVGFRLSSERVAGTIATDLGEIGDRVATKLADCDWMVLESNHDEEMLRLGTYPYNLKQRLVSRIGHLSNRAFAGFLSERFDGKARHVLLAHLSQNNNHPEIAMDWARQALGRRSTRSLHDLWDPCQIHLTYQDRPSVVLEL